ncbi:MAG: alpha/beta fold hydrolase [Fimbriimonadaceae bacterium]
MMISSAFLLALQFSQTDTMAEGLPRRGSLGIPFAPVPADLLAKLNLKAGEGVLAMKPLPGLTAENAGLMQGDVVVALNGKPIGPATVSSTVREIAANSEVTFKVLRDGKTIQLKSKLMERPRDPGNANFSVTYSDVMSNGNRMRTIITTPKKAGKHPALMFIQGFSPVSYDYVLETSKGDVSTIDGPILFDFANDGFVTIRVEKPGVGDSEGGPFAPMDYTTELDIYRQTLKQLKGMSDVDTENIFIFGHSMGGAFGPMIAAESPVKGLAVYGVAARTWFEYLLDTIRYQGLVGGASFEAADEEARQGARLMSLVFLENKSVEEVKKSHPKLAEAADAYFPGGLFNGKSLDFWRQLAQTNFASYWAKCNARVLAVRGESDFVTYDADHKLIADIVNRVHPGWGQFAIAPSSDHLFHNFPTEAESMKNFQKGTFNIGFSKMMKDWIKDVMKSEAHSVRSGRK